MAVTIASPYAGTVAYQHVDDGVHVAEGEAVVELEAMKMMTALTAPCAGTVRHLVQLGEVVAQDQPVAEIVED